MGAEEGFKAIVVREDKPGGFTSRVEDRRIDELPSGELLVRVDFSSLNYKDALSASGNRGVTRSYPHTPGIDAAGAVEESDSADFKPGDEVVVMGFDLGMNTPGGFGRYIRVPAAWALPLPRALSVREAMSYGTAGFTAALAALRLTDAGLAPGGGLPLVVSGASGGVGGFAVAFLSRLGFPVTAVSGKPDAAGYLERLGAARVVGREAVIDTSGKLLVSARWQGGVDTVGGATLSSLLRSVDRGGALAACGNVSSGEFSGSVYPFILRGVALLGIDASSTPVAVRRRVWAMLSGAWRLPPGTVEVAEVGLAQLPRMFELMLGGKIRGRVVVDLSS